MGTDGHENHGDDGDDDDEIIPPPPAATSSSRVVFFFDVDNCIFGWLIDRDLDADKKVHDLMRDLIDDYITTHLSLSRADAIDLHRRYFTDYGLALSGLVQHHKIDALDYNAKVDDALPLDTLITPDPQLRQLLTDIDKSKVKLWLFTNAYVTHANRIVRLLGIEDLFEGVTFCDYGEVPLVSKPMGEMFGKAEREAGASAGVEGEVGGWYFVDDSYSNCHHAQTRGWTTIHLLEPEDPDPPTRASKYQIRSLEEIRGLFPGFFV